jgi:hypothetical protein
MPTHGDLWIRRNEIRPLWWDRANGYIIDTEQKALSIAVVPLTYAREPPAAERMERMRYLHKTRGSDRITCISNGATNDWKKAPSRFPRENPVRSASRSRWKNWERC